MQLIFVTNTDKKRDRIQIDKIDDSGNCIASSIQYFDADAHYKVAAGLLGIKPVALQGYVRNYRMTGEARFDLTPITLAIASNMPTNVYIVRKLDSSDSKTYTTFREAMQNGTEGSVIEWSAISVLCAIDLDFHGIDTPLDLDRFAATIRPRPSCRWITRGNGLRLIYEPVGRYNADELAAIAAWQCMERYPQAKLELLTRTRFPPASNIASLHWQTSTDDIGKLGRLSTVEGDSSEFANYLEENNYEPGQRYSHTLCPHNPSARAERNTPPF